MRGAVSAGMCVVLEAAGAVPAFDRIYGVSAGALNGWATAVGQAALGATHYQDAVQRAGHRPHPGAAPAARHRLRAAVRGAHRHPQAAVLRASVRRPGVPRAGDVARDHVAARPAGLRRRLGGPSGRAGERIASPAGRGATGVPRRAHDRRGPHRADPVRDPGGRGRDPRPGAPLVLGRMPQTGACGARRATRAPRGPAPVRAGPGAPGQVQPPGGRAAGRHARCRRRPRRPGHRSRRHPAHRPPRGRQGRVVQALRLGAAAMASTLLTDAVSLCWQPVVYRAAAPVQLPVAAAPVAVAHAARWRPRARRASGWSSAS